MSLPFLKPKYQQTGLMVTTRTPDGGNAPDSADLGQDQAMHAVAEDLIQAITAKDAMRLAQALKSAFEIMDSAEDAETIEES